jgi:hypothetical protein
MAVRLPGFVNYLAASALLLLGIAAARAWSGFVVQVVDDAGTPVAAARVRFRDGVNAGGQTDASGWVRLRDAWIHAPFARSEAWLCVSKGDRWWWFTYPLPSILCLEEAQTWPR